MANTYIKGTMENLGKEDIIKDKYQINDYFDIWYPSLVVFAKQFLSNQAEAEDVVQNAFVKLFENFESGKNINAMKGYLYRIIRNECLNVIKHQKVKQRYGSEMENVIHTEKYYVQKVIEEETMATLAAAVETLPPQCKQVLYLSLNGLKNNEIAEDLNISVNTVKSQKLKAYRRLREQLSNLYQIVGFLTGT